MLQLKKGLSLFILVTQFLFASAQKEDRVWAFGHGAGIDFNDLNNPVAFRSNCDNIEANASISDSNGNLLFYLANQTAEGYPYAILDGDHNIISGGDSILAQWSMTNGIVILPFASTLFYLIYVSYVREGDFGCPFGEFYCMHIYYSVLQEDSVGQFKVLKKNIPLLSETISEKLAAVRHANGNDWWLIIPKANWYPDTSSTNLLYKFLVTTEGVEGPYEQNIGALTCSGCPYGEMVFSKNGDQVAEVGLKWANNTYRSNIELYNFDRCTGQLFNYRAIESSIVDDFYSVEFSSNGNVLYAAGGGELHPPKLFQYNLLNHFKYQIWTDTSNNLSSGQLQLGPDDKIYYTVANGFAGFGNSGYYNQYTQNLGVVNAPNSLGVSCDFQPYSFYLGDSSRTYSGLPNMPNYNLGPLSIYQADAGGDTIICEEDTTVKGVFLGIPAVTGVTYSWYPSDSLNHINIAQPFASPTVSTWYYVTLTDTSIKYSCQSRTDSVFVEVKDCSVGIEEASSHKLLAVSVFPNPASETIHVSNLTPDIAHLILTDISGKQILQTTQTTIPVAALSTGLYFVKVIFESGQSVVKKVVIE